MAAILQSHLGGMLIAKWFEHCHLNPKTCWFNTGLRSELHFSPTSQRLG